MKLSQEHISITNLRNMLDFRRVTMTVRELKDYTTKEQEELEIIGALVPVTDFLDSTFNDRYPNLSKKIRDARPNGEKQILYDLADYLRGYAEFPERKYYVQLINQKNGFLNKYIDSDICTVSGIDTEFNLFQTQFTMDEIKDIDERYVPFAVPIDEVDDDE